MLQTGASEEHRRGEPSKNNSGYNRRDVISIGKLVRKGFDGTRNMFGKDNSVQQHLTAAGGNKSLHSHGFAHRLNLVLEKSVNTPPAEKVIFGNLGQIPFRWT